VDIGALINVSARTFGEQLRGINRGCSFLASLARETVSLGLRIRPELVPLPHVLFWWPRVTTRNPTGWGHGLRFQFKPGREGTIWEDRPRP